MGQVLFANNISTTLTAGIGGTSGDTTIPVASVAGLPAISGGNYYYGTLSDVSGNIEIVKVTGVAGLDLTVVRGQDGTTPLPFLSGDRFELRLVTAALNEFANVNDPSVTFAGVVTAANSFSAPQLISTVATGTAPIVVASTTKVDNLNADLLDGFSVSEAAAIDTIPVRSATGDIASTTFTGTLVGNVNGTLDGEDSTDFHDATQLTGIVPEANLTAATDAVKGILELATQAEVDAGVDTERAVTPATLAARGVGVTTEVFTTADVSVPVPTGATMALVELWGAGGGGARSDNNSDTAMGGEGGSYVAALIPVKFLSTDGAFAISVGAGGTGDTTASTGSNDATDGGDTTLTLENYLGTGTSYAISARGGRRGNSAAAAGPASYGSVSGVTTGYVPGGNTMFGSEAPGARGTPAATVYSGAGGGTHIGSIGGTTPGGTSTYGGDGGAGGYSSAGAGTIPGGGGGGSAGAGSVTGGAGADGQIRITWLSY